MIILFVIASIIIVYQIIKLITITILFIKHKNTSRILYRSIEPFKDKSQFYIIPTIKYTKGTFSEFNLLWGKWGIYICYKFLTDDEDIEITDTLYFNNKHDKSK